MPVAAAAGLMYVLEDLRNLCPVLLALCTLIWFFQRFGHALALSLANT